MAYNVIEAAADLLLEPEELKEILDIFFCEAVVTLSDCDKALGISDFATLKKLFHTLKGSASNFRITELSEKAVVLEEGAKSFDLPLIEAALPIFREELSSIQEQVEKCFE